MREIADRARISPSKAYAITNGDDNVEFETFEAIADAFGMSPAELATAIGKGPAGDDPELAPMHARLRQVPKDQRTVVDRLIATFIPPTRAKSHPATDTKRSQRDRNVSSNGPEEPQDDVLKHRKRLGWASLAPQGA